MKDLVKKRTEDELYLLIDKMVKDPAMKIVLGDIVCSLSGQQGARVYEIETGPLYGGEVKEIRHGLSLPQYSFGVRDSGNKVGVELLQKTPYDPTNAVSIKVSQTLSEGLTLVIIG